MIKLTFTCFINLLSYLTVFGQSWVGLGSGIDWGAKYFYIDTLNDLLYVSGNFEYAGSIHVNQIASWNGNEWDSLGPGIAFGGAAYSITSYQNKLYVSGAVTTDLSHLLATWDGNVWDTTGLQIDGAIGTYLQKNGQLIVGGSFTTAGNQPAICMAQFDGTVWSYFPTGTWQGAGLFALTEFNNEIYCGGIFYEPVNSISRFCKWNGSSFTPLGNLGGGFTSIACMMVYQNELYIGGYFTTALGAVSDYIMKWNGTSFSNVGSGVNSTVRCMRVYNQELYVGGDFDLAGGYNAKSIAKWNGTNWQPVTTATFDGGIHDIAFYQNQLYVLGGFHHINSDSIKYIAKLDGLIGRFA